MPNAYRSDPEQFVRLRVAQLEAARERLEPRLPVLRAIYVARMSRMLGGAVAIGGAAGVVLSVLAGVNATTVLCGAGASGLLAYGLGRIAFPLSARRGLTAEVGALRLSGNTQADLMAIDAANPALLIEKKLARLDTWSSALPLAAVSLLTPLLLHFVVALLLGSSLHEYDKWIAISMALVGHAHLALVAMVIRFARKMARADVDSLAAMPIHRAWGAALGVAVAVSCVPGILFLAVPPVLSVITGLAFIPWMYIAMHRVLCRERRTISLVAEDARMNTPFEPQLLARGPLIVTTKWMNEPVLKNEEERVLDDEHAEPRSIARGRRS